MNEINHHACDLAAAQAGDAAALHRVLVAQRGRVRRYAERHCPIHDVEDAVQETLLTISRELTALRVLRALNVWMFRIVKHVCDRYKYLIRNYVHDYAPDQPMPEPVFRSTSDLQIDLAAALESLPPHYRQVLWLRDVQEFTIDEMATELGASRESVKARLHRARALVREYLR